MYEFNMQGAVHVVSGNAPLKEEAIHQFRDAFDKLLAVGQPLTVLDMAGIPLIDSVGLEALLEMQERMCKRGGYLKLATPTPLCRDILSVTSVDEHFEIFDRVLDAVGSFAK